MKRLRQNKSLLVSNSRWLAYAAAGAATTLGAAQSAEAEIHYSGPINAKFDGRGHLVIPLDHEARLHFDSYTYTLDFTIDDATVSNKVCGFKKRFGTHYLSRLPQGAAISNCRFVPEYGVVLNLAPYSGGRFYERGEGFIGFRFDNGAGIQYGWVRLQMPGPRYLEARFLLVDYAWGDPGDQVRTGQKSLAGDQAEGMPDQGSLGLLALGGAGLMAWRWRRVKAH